MRVPVPPNIRKLDRITPTIYEAALKCISRAAWIASGNSRLLPPHPRSLLGIAVHAVLERARSAGNAAGTEVERAAAAERLFDEKMEELFRETHPLLRAKFESRDRLPFYNLYRARAAQMAAEWPSGPDPQTISNTKQAAPTDSRLSVEAPLTSRDGRISGRPDVLDGPNATVVDYKTTQPSEPTQITESETRQLRLYAFLAEENGIAVRRGIIERADRARVEVQISAAEAAEEGRHALAVLDKYNGHIGAAFNAGAKPSPQACRFCPCIPFCNAFWELAEVGWASECGTHLEGKVETVDGDALISVHLNVVRGTGLKGSAVVTRLSREWLTFDGSSAPSPGQTVRITDAAYVGETSSPSIFRADRVTTTVWTVRDVSPSGATDGR